MADSFDLSHEEYLRFIHYCKISKSGFGIINFIGQRLREHYKNNPDFIITMMEHVEEACPTVMNDFLDEEDYINENAFYRKDILNFKLECKNIKQPQLRFLYSYLCSLSEDEQKFKEIIGIDIEKPKVNAESTFNTSLNQSSLLKIFDFLIKKEFIDKRTTMESYMAVFNNQPLNDIRPIKWVARATSGADMTSLFELIKHLCSWEYGPTYPKEIFYSKISRCFVRYDNSEMVKSAIRRKWDRWDEFDTTEKLLKSPNKNSKAFDLISFLKELKLPTLTVSVPK